MQSLVRPGNVRRLLHTVASALVFYRRYEVLLITEPAKLTELALLNLLIQYIFSFVWECKTQRAIKLNGGQ